MLDLSTSIHAAPTSYAVGFIFTLTENFAAAYVGFRNIGYLKWREGVPQTV
jgi:hypothetical protein